MRSLTYSEFMHEFRPGGFGLIRCSEFNPVTGEKKVIEESKIVHIICDHCGHVVPPETNGAETIVVVNDRGTKAYDVDCGKRWA